MGGSAISGRPTWLIVLVAVAALSGCDGDGASATAPSSSTTSAATGSAAAVTACRHAVPATLTATLQRHWTTGTSSEVIPFASVGSSEVVAQVLSPAFRGVARVSGAGTITPIRAFEGPEHQAGGSFDGRYAVWKEYASRDSLDLFGVFEWDASTGRITRVGGSHGQGDATFPSPWADPVIHGGRATWVEGTDASGAGRIVVLDLATATTWVARSGHPQPAAFVGDLLVWGESPAPDIPVVASAVDLASRTAVPAPKALAAEHGFIGLVGDGTALAWVEGTTGKGLRFAAGPDSAPATVYEVADGGYNPPLQVVGTVVAGTESAGSFIVNATTGSAYLFTDRYGISVHGPMVWLPGQPRVGAATPNARVSLADATPPAC